MDDQRHGKPTNMRKYARQTERHLAVAVVLFITIVAAFLVWLFMGGEVARAALVCSVGGALLFGLLYGLLVLLGRVSDSVWRR
ncbi:MAG: hypothetical protein KIS91_11080 [Anaerolineae bacterium]|nr:hypothetical protein [Anaerolineae bacterium]